MTDDIIRKATTADYIETIDNLRAEVKRLRSFEEFSKKLITLWIYMADAEEVLQNHRMRILEISQNMIDEQSSKIADKDARNKELEEMIRQLGSLAFMGDMPLDQIVAHFIAWGQSNYDYTSRLEVAFLRSNAAMRYYQEGNRGPWPQLGEKFKEPYQEKAREALARIKEERKG